MPKHYLIIGMILVIANSGCALFEAFRGDARAWRLDDQTQIIARFECHCSAITKSPDVNYKRSTLVIRSAEAREDEATLKLEGEDRFGDFRTLEARSDERRNIIWLVNKAPERVVAVILRSTLDMPSVKASLEYGPNVGVVLPSAPNIFPR